MSCWEWVREPAGGACKNCTAEFKELQLVKAAKEIPEQTTEDAINEQSELAWACSKNEYPKHVKKWRPHLG